MITYRLDELREATEAIQEAEAKAEGSNNEKALSLIAEAKRLVSEVPVTASQASNPEFAAVFTKKRKKATDSVGARQAEIEQAWDKATLENYNKATELAEQASSIL